MTVAICVKCGTEKFGALAPCRKCNFYPQDVLDRAKSTVLSDHHLDTSDLRRIGQEIRDGTEPQLPQEVVDEYVALFEAELLNQGASPSKPNWLTTVFTFLGVLLIPVGFAFLLVFGFKVADRLIQRPAVSPISSGTIVQLNLSFGESGQYVGSHAAIYYDYIRVDGESGNKHWIPREQVKQIVLSQ